MVSKYNIAFVVVLGCTTLNIISTVSGEVHSNIRSGYNESCNKTVRCKSQSWLTCDQETNTCRCAREDEMIYDSTRNKCVALIGERCKFGFDEDDEGYGANSWYGKSECVQGAVCGPSGTCSCPNGYFEDQLMNRCTPVKNYGSSCVQRFECNQDKFLNCVGGQCKCDEDNAIYNLEEFTGVSNYYYRVPAGVCVGRVGTRCSDSEGKYCVRNSHCNLGKCACSSGYTETSEKLCGLGYNQGCSESTICSDKLRCSSTRFTTSSYNTVTRYHQEIKCHCPYPKYQIYNSPLSTCQGLVGGPCDPNDSTSCVDKSICIERDNMFQCECPDGYVENVLGKCEIAHGFPCEYIAELSDANLCDRKADLRCKNRKCACEDEADIYEPIRRQCSTPVGVRCETHTQCVSNAVCRKELTDNFGRCSCAKGFEVTKNHICAGMQMANLNTGLNKGKNELNETTTRPTAKTATVEPTPDYDSSAGFDE